MRIITLGTGHGDPNSTRFNSSTLLQCGEKNYLIDAGAPAAALLIRRGINISQLRGIFLTHLHEDHFGGLSGLIKHIVKYPPEQAVPIYLPEEKEQVFLDLIAASHRPVKPGTVVFRHTQEGLVYEDEVLTIEAVRTRHFDNEGADAPSFGYVFTEKSTGKRHIHTGDLKHDFSDFPVSVCTEGATCVCELTHYPWSAAEPILQKVPLKKIIFAHIWDSWTPEAVAEFDLPYPAILAEDGDEFEL